MSFIEEIIESYPIRKSKKQKESFWLWAKNRAEEMGYSANIEVNKRNYNVVIGNPETAEVTFTAHYDTPPAMPIPNFITPKNVVFYIFYQLIVVGLLVGVCVGIGAIAYHFTNNYDASYNIGFGFYWILLGLMLLGPANKNNVNDNSSGVAAIFEIMQRLPQEERNKVAFILFDNEEKGMMGSSAYAKMHKSVKAEKLLINMDCVGDGENILFFANKKTRQLESYDKLVSAMEAQLGRNLLMNKLEGCLYPSDQSQFKLGIAVCACKKAKVIGYYCNKIHTRRDTVCEQENLDFIANGLSQFVSSL